MWFHTLRNLLLLTLTVALGVAIWRSDQGTDANAPGPILAIDPHGIERIEIVRQDRERVILTRQGPTWRLHSPWQVNASPLAVAALLSLASGPSLADYPLETSARFGLSPPQATVLLDGIRLQLGATDAIDNRRYLASNNRLHLIADTAAPYWGGAEANLVDRRPIPADAHIVGLHVGDIDIQEDGKGGWLVARPHNADTRFGQRLIDSWHGLKASQVIESPVADTQGAPVRIDLFPPYSDTKFILQETASGTRLLRPDLGLAWLLPTGSEKAILGQTPDLAAKP
ncbi:MAG: hypothetical protein KDH88_07335 [Chromatiales bacterium]|nr:hypothetical protein [Chromatiales bacterium]